MSILYCWPLWPFVCLLLMMQWRIVMFNNVEIARAIEEFLASSPTLTTANGVGFRNGVVTILTRVLP
jgi:hypothetical protein